LQKAVESVVPTGCRTNHGSVPLTGYVGVKAVVGLVVPVAQISIAVVVCPVVLRFTCEGLTTIVG
jgi:hypothetical protein